MNIADRIQALRKAKGISQDELADHIGVSRQAVSKWESEQSLPDIDRIIALSDYFGTTTDYLLKGIERAPGKSPREVNALLMALAGTIVNAAGLVAAIVVWAERQEAYAAGIGLIPMLAGIFLFLLGQLTDARDKERARPVFFMANVWILPVIPLYCLLNAMAGRLWHTHLVNLAIWALYLAGCAAFDLALYKRFKER